MINISKHFSAIDKIVSFDDHWMQSIAIEENKIFLMNLIDINIIESVKIWDIIDIDMILKIEIKVINKWINNIA